MAQVPRRARSGIVLGTLGAHELAALCRRLLGRRLEQGEPGWVKLRAPTVGPGLSFPTEGAYIPPAWSAGPGDPQMLAQLDFEVNDLDAAGAHTVGARLAERQPQGTVRVYPDPAERPFCLFLPELALGSRPQAPIASRSVRSVARS